MGASHHSGPGDRLQVAVGVDSVELATFLGAEAGQNVTLFRRTFQITSAAGATAVNIITDAEVGSTRKVVVMGFSGKVDGATDWATTANVKIQDTNSSPVDFFTILVAALTGNAEVGPHTSAVGENAFLLGTGGTAGKGLQVKANANGTGSTLKGQVWGYILG